MNTQEQANFKRITKAIEYIQARFKAQPGLAEIAEHVELSPSHFQRLFTDWAGTSPKKFLQYISIEHAKKLLNKNRTSLLEASMKTGLSGSGRLHDLFVTIEGMTPGEYKNGGASLVLNYNFAQSPFGEIIIASTSKGVCYLAFVMQTHTEALADLRFRFPQATLREQRDSLQESALTFFTQDWNKRAEIKLHLKGTAFQLKVWEALLKIPMGQLSTYGTIATNIHTPNACRAVGTAVGQNPVSFLIPCHRVIQSSGVLGNYHWGPTRKTAMIGWEAARTV
jgi:AraC family transcriptional regulator of adaptative response/methylated-DNA-[protein]-cysteine methyltransferase